MAPPGEAIKLDPVSLILNSSGPVFVVVWLLIGASVVVWLIAILKLLQLRRWTRAEMRFEADVGLADSAEEMFETATHHDNAPGARVVRAMERRATSDPDLLTAVAKRAVVSEQQTASSLMPTLASIGSASPFVGLFGTVYGIMDAFLRIGREKSASLPVVAPAIGEALIATAIGLFAAIPAVIAYNAIAKRMDDLINAVEASADSWVVVAGLSGDPPTAPRGLAGHSAEDQAFQQPASDGALPVPLRRRSEPPPFPGA